MLSCTLLDVKKNLKKKNFNHEMNYFMSLEITQNTMTKFRKLTMKKH